MLIYCQRETFSSEHCTLSTYSPVFEAMFRSEMKKRYADGVELKEINSADHFADFLAIFSPSPQRALPNRLFFILKNQTEMIGKF